jgi:hypothetical protein
MMRADRAHIDVRVVASAIRQTNASVPDSGGRPMDIIIVPIAVAVAMTGNF